MDKLDKMPYEAEHRDELDINNMIIDQESSIREVSQDICI